MIDKIDHASTLTALHRLGIHEDYIAVVQDAYTNPTFYVQGYDGDKAPATPHTGIRHGCPLSPYLFIMVMTRLRHDVEEKLVVQGLPTNNWSKGKPTFDLQYADDTLLMGVTTRAL